MSDELQQTVLHSWHEEHGGKLIDFAGWHMPVQYQAGAIQEHLATRRRAGLFDVSHMGRFEIEGAGAEDFLLRGLTNNARALKVGEAQYTFIPNEAGGAIDDAYLYKLAPERFLLVVNASNRDKDWAWLEGLKDGADCTMKDVSAELAMVSLQGPEASHVLEEVVAKRDLPDNKRNKLSVARADGCDVIVSRTGYTGEAICFELFVPSENAVVFCDALVDAGAEVAGLAARDSLRLEAGLPLYGHELGEADDGTDIPIFTNTIAPAGVRLFDHVEPHCVGQEALEAQREEFAAIRRHELTTPVGDRVLQHMIQPIAVFNSKRPLRAGYKLLHDGEEVGLVTSGTSVPSTAFAGAGLTATPADDHTMRPIGLALLRSDIRYRSDRPVVLDIADDRGNTFEAELVERNLWPAAPFTRPYTGFQLPRGMEPLHDKDFAQEAARLAQESEANHAWRRTECVNLIPSEQTTSAFVDRLSVTDPSSRYNEHNRLKALGPEADDVRYYKGTSFIMEKEQELQAALCTYFGCSRAETRVISGQMANDTVYDALKQFRNRQRKRLTPRNLGPVLVHDLNKGGHLSAQVSGALKNYVAMDPVTGRPSVEHFPIQTDNPHRIDVEKAKEIIAEARPELIVFGRSVIIHTEPVAEIAAFVHQEFGRDNPERPVIHYDGAHVLGLLVDAFQRPLVEGADLITGSTHKTFFGPQRGVILSNIDHGSPFEDLWGFIEQRTFPGHVSNHHLGTLLGLLGATYEMLAHRDEYPGQVISNAKAFARALASQDLELEGDPACDFTETHQVLLRTARGKGEFIADLLESNNIITNPQAFHDDASFAAASGVRMGSQEMTRHGMKEADFEEFAGLLAEIVHAGEDKPRGHYKDAVKAFRSRFTEMQYCF